MLLSKTVKAMLSFVCCVVFLAGPAGAGEKDDKGYKGEKKEFSFLGGRHFAFTEEIYTLKPGKIKFEQHGEWLNDKIDKDAAFDQFDIKSKFKIGVTKDFLAAITVKNAYQDGKTVSDNGLEFKTIGVEGLWQIEAPSHDELGIGARGLFAIGEEKIKGEASLLLGKHIEDIVLAYNLTFVGLWEGPDYNDETGKLINTIAAAYPVIDNASLGGELYIQNKMPDFESLEAAAVFIGPNAAYYAEDWFVVLTPLFQITDVYKTNDMKVRIQVGIRLP